MSNFVNNLKLIIEILSISPCLDFSHPQLPQFAGNKINTPTGDVIPLLLRNPSPLPDQVIDLTLLKEFVSALDQKQTIIRLDHVGFCYQVVSQIQEKKRIIDLIRQSTTHLYEESSNNDGLWLFVGDVANWKDPVIELLPIETTSDPYKNYWLPHIQIDIDTTLTAEKIIDLVNTVFNGEIQPFPIAIEGVIYIIRCRLGIIDGINIFLDVATSARNVQYARQHMWNQII